MLSDAVSEIIIYKSFLATPLLPYYVLQYKLALPQKIL